MDLPSHGRKGMSEREFTITVTPVDPKLASTVQDAIDAGNPPPCLGADRRLWTSDLPADRTRALTKCDPCAALDACRDAADRTREHFGVWAGQDRGPSPWKTRR
jgi:Transcription factor WhiB